MSSKSKTKGSSWEREVCKILSDNLGGSFIRSNNSGAFIGGKNSQRKNLLEKNQVRNMKGDIVPPDNLSKLNIEAKNYNDIAFHQIINGNCKQLDEWIEQTELPSDEHDLNLIIFKITRKGSWIVFPSSYESHFSLNSYCVYKNSKNDYIVTDFIKFIEDNKDVIIQLGS